SHVPLTPTPGSLTSACNGDFRVRNEGGADAEQCSHRGRQSLAVCVSNAPGAHRVDYRAAEVVPGLLRLVDVRLGHRVEVRLPPPPGPAVRRDEEVQEPLL